MPLHIHSQSQHLERRRSSRNGLDNVISHMDDIQLDINWEEIICPICLDFPHNGVLLQCSSYNKGCRPFVCDTNRLLSNCLDRFKIANGMTCQSDTELLISKGSQKPCCPLCRGDVSGWIIIDKARSLLDEKKRSCEEERCKFVGTYLELQGHAQREHPHSHPSKIDPARWIDWENFQQSSDIIDILNTVHSEVPRGVVLGDYVIEYGDDESGDEYEDFPGDEGNWWTSCILYQVFDNFRSSRNRRRSRVSDTRRGTGRISFETSNSDDGSVISGEFSGYGIYENDDELVSTSRSSRHRSYRRRRPHFLDD